MISYEALNLIKRELHLTSIMKKLTPRCGYQYLKGTTRLSDRIECYSLQFYVLINHTQMSTKKKSSIKWLP